MPKPCPDIRVQWIVQGAAALCGVNQSRVYGHVIGMSLFVLRGPNMLGQLVFVWDGGPLATSILYTSCYIEHRKSYSCRLLHRHLRMTKYPPPVVQNAA